MAAEPGAMALYDVSIPRSMQPHLLALVRGGLYGDTPQAALRQLVAEGLRRAFADGLIMTTTHVLEVAKP